MGSRKGYALSLNGTALDGFKADFDNLLTRTIRTMREKGVGNATIAAKIEISLSTVEGRNLYPPDSVEEREYTVPEFKHKVAASMQLKEDVSGKTGGNKFELLWDSSAGVFVMAPMGDENQTSLFDGDGGDGGGAG